MEEIDNILNGLSEAIVVNRNGIALYVNQAFAELVGEADAESTLNHLSSGSDFYHMVHADDRGLVMHYAEQRQKDNREIPNCYSFRFNTPLAGERRVECRAREIQWHEQPATLASYRDISHQYKEGRSDLLLRLLFEESLNAIPCMICITDASTGKMIYYNEYAANLFKYDRTELLGKTTENMDVWVDYEDREVMIRKIQAKEPVTDFHAYQRDSEGNIFPMSINATLLTSQPSPLIFMASFDRSDEHRQQEILEKTNEKLDFLARHDSLTGLFNRREGAEYLAREVASYQRYDNPLSVLMLDIDHFKGINDNHGHDVGDAVLVEVCKRIERAIREVDICFRWGGEEFLVIAPSTDIRVAVKIAERIRQAVADEPIPIRQAEPVPITLSIGCAGMVAEVFDTEAILKIADDALYEAKSLGRNRVVVAGENSPSISTSS